MRELQGLGLGGWLLDSGRRGWDRGLSRSRLSFWVGLFPFWMVEGVGLDWIMG